jgi:hypothetical protein
VSWDAVHNQNRFPSEQDSFVRDVSFAAPGGTPLTMTMTATVNVALPSTGGAWCLMCNGWRVTPLYSNAGTGLTPTITHNASSMLGNVLRLVIIAYPTGQAASLTAYGSGTITAASRSGTYTNTQTVVVAPAASQVTVTNSLNLTGNSVADIMIGDALLVDATRSAYWDTTPADNTPKGVINNILMKYCNDSTLIQIGTLPTSFKFNGALTEYKKAIDWLDGLAWQAGCWYRRTCGVSKLIVRTATPTSQKTIPACVLTDEGIKKYTRRKADVTGIVNTINLLFDRDWSSSNSKAEACKQTATGTDATSISNYGVKESPDHFIFDFVTDPVMAAALVTLYLALYADRQWQVTFSTYLDHCEMEFGDGVTLGFANNLLGTIIEAGLNPGDSGTMDMIDFTVLTNSIP